MLAESADNRENEKSVLGSTADDAPVMGPPLKRLDINSPDGWGSRSGKRVRTISGVLPNASPCIASH